MSRDLGEIYSLEWYEHDFAGLQPEFDLVAAGINRWARYRHSSALDVGCGPGMLVHALREHGWSAVGYDGSPHALAYAKEIGTHHSLALRDALAKPTDQREVVLCTEVAEHVPIEHAPLLVANIVKQATRAIIFTAAPPGQGGHDHVNEQPREYWLDLFADHGWIEDEGSTTELRRRWSKLKRLSHMPRNVMVLR